MTVGDITISNGILTACSYSFEGNADGTNLIIPDDLGIIGIIDAETDWMGELSSMIMFYPDLTKLLQGILHPFLLTSLKRIN